MSSEGKLLSRKEKRARKKKKLKQSVEASQQPLPVALASAQEHSAEEYAEARAEELLVLQSMYLEEEELQILNDGEDGTPARVQFTAKPSELVSECHVAVKLIATQTEHYPFAASTATKA